RDGLTKHTQLGDFCMALPQARHDAPVGPAWQPEGLECHEAVGHIPEDVSRRKALELLKLNPLDELGTRRPVLDIVGEVVDQGVGIEKDRGARWDAGKGHGDSRMLNSSSSAMRRRISGSPVQGSIPAVRSAQVSAGSTVTRTFSCSLSGSGCAGLSTPFSYTA